MAEQCTERKSTKAFSERCHNGWVSGLDPKYRFDNFVVGNHNMLAQTVSLAVAEDPGKI